jgi:hypothetical protein
MQRLLVLDRLTNRAVVGADVTLMGPPPGFERLGNLRTGENGMVEATKPLPPGSRWEVRHEFFLTGATPVVEGVQAMYLERGTDGIIPESILGNEIQNAPPQSPDAISDGNVVQEPVAPSLQAPPSAGAGFLGIPLPLLVAGVGGLLYIASLDNKEEKEEPESHTGRLDPLPVNDIFGEDED